MAKSKSAAVAEVIDADAALIQAIPELVPTRDESMTIGDFLRSLTPFFTTARALEQTAKETLVIARGFTAPTNAGQDASLQTFIKSASVVKRKVEDHWTVTSTLFNFQRRLVTVRKRATDALDEAAGIAQRLHNTYAHQERQKAQAEQDRLNREAEQKAQADREAELARLEQLALDAEAASAELSEREQNFVAFYVVRGSAESAANSAGYKEPFKAGARLISMPKILAAIEAKRQAIALRDQKTAVAATPLDVQTPDVVRPNIAKVGTDRTTKSAEVYDADAFMAALLDPRTRTTLGIPAEVATFDQAKLNQYARDLGELIARWPGVRLVKKTTTV